MVHDADVARLASSLGVDRRSVVRRLAGLPVRGASGSRIDEALRAATAMPFDGSQQGTPRIPPPAYANDQPRPPPPFKYDPAYHGFSFRNAAAPLAFDGWTLERVRGAISQHRQGLFLESSTLALVTLSFPPVFAALHQRMAPILALPRYVRSGTRGLARLVGSLYERQLAPSKGLMPSPHFPVTLWGTTVFDLAFMGFSVWQHAYGDVTTDVETGLTWRPVYTRRWPTWAVVYQRYRRTFYALTDQGPVDIINDGKFTLVADSDEPHFLGAIVPLGEEALDGKSTQRGRAGYIDKYTDPKWIGTMPPDVPTMGDEGDAFFNVIGEVINPGGRGVIPHGAAVDIKGLGADASTVLKDSLESNIMMVAMVMLGSSGTMQAGNDGVYQSPTFKEVSRNVVDRDVKTIVRSVNGGHIAPSMENSFGADIATAKGWVDPVLDIPLPDPEADKRIESYGKRVAALIAQVVAERAAGFRPTQERVEQLAKGYDVEPPTLDTIPPIPQWMIETKLAAPDEPREQVGLPPLPLGAGSLDRLAQERLGGKDQISGRGVVGLDPTAIGAFTALAKTVGMRPSTAGVVAIMNEKGLGAEPIPPGDNTIQIGPADIPKVLSVGEGRVSIGYKDNGDTRYIAEVGTVAAPAEGGEPPPTEPAPSPAPKGDIAGVNDGSPGGTTARAGRRTLRARTFAVRAGSPDQERDDHGRFGSGSGEATKAKQEKDRKKALKESAKAQKEADDAKAEFEEANADVDNKNKKDEAILQKSEADVDKAREEMNSRAQEWRDSKKAYDDASDEDKPAAQERLTQAESEFESAQREYGNRVKADEENKSIVEAMDHAGEADEIRREANQRQQEADLHAEHAEILEMNPADAHEKIADNASAAWDKTTEADKSYKVASIEFKEAREASLADPDNEAKVEASWAAKDKLNEAEEHLELAEAKAEFWGDALDRSETRIDTKTKASADMRWALRDSSLILANNPDQERDAGGRFGSGGGGAAEDAGDEDESPSALKQRLHDEAREEADGRAKDAEKVAQRSEKAASKADDRASKDAAKAEAADTEADKATERAEKASDDYQVAEDDHRDAAEAHENAIGEREEAAEELKSTKADEDSTDEEISAAEEAHETASKAEEDAKTSLDAAEARMIEADEAMSKADAEAERASTRASASADRAEESKNDADEAREGAESDRLDADLEREHAEILNASSPDEARAALAAKDEAAQKDVAEKKARMNEANKTAVDARREGSTATDDERQALSTANKEARNEWATAESAANFWGSAHDDAKERHETAHS